MTEALVISNLVLWLVVVLMALVIAALARQLGVLSERVAPAGALAIHEGPPAAKASPNARWIQVSFA